MKEYCCTKCNSPVIVYPLSDMVDLCKVCSDKMLFDSPPYCVICNKALEIETIARRDNGDYRKDINSDYWCQKCVDKFDELEPK